MKYDVNIHNKVQKYLNARNIETKKRLVEGLRLLTNDPLSHAVKKLKGTKGRQDLYRLRIGDLEQSFLLKTIPCMSLKL